MRNDSMNKAIRQYLDANYPDEMRAFKEAYKFLLSDIYYGGLGDAPEDYTFSSYCDKANDAINSLPSSLYYCTDTDDVSESDYYGAMDECECGETVDMVMERTYTIEIELKDILIDPNLRGHI